MKPTKGEKWQDKADPSNIVTILEFEDGAGQGNGTVTVQLMNTEPQAMALHVLLNNFVRIERPFLRGSAQYEESMQAELEEEWDEMDETDASNEEYFQQVMLRDD